MKPIPLEALEHFLGQKSEKKPTDSPEKSFETTSPSTSHILDLTDQYVGQSLIFTGAASTKKDFTLTEREESLRSATEKPPEK